MKTNLLLSAVFILFAWPATADDTPEPATGSLRQLIEAGRYAEAWEMASTMAADFEGDPEFDFYYGLSATQTGHHQPALFSFERLSASYPQVQRYRLELARSYFYLGNLDQAEAEFRRVLAANPPSAVRTNIERFLSQIAAQRDALNPRWQSSLSVAGGYDSNINSATSAEQIEFFFASGSSTSPLSDDQRRTGSPFWQVRGITTYQSPLSSRSAWDFTAAASRKDNTMNQDFDLSSLSVQTGIRHLFRQIQVRSSLSAAQHWIDDTGLQQDIGLSAELYWRYRPALQPFARLQINHLNSAVNDDLDMLRPQLQTGLNWSRNALSAQAMVSYSSDHSLNDADYQARDMLGVSLSGQYRWHLWDLYSSLSWRDSDFQAASTDPIANGKTRAEQLLQILAGGRYPLTPRLSAYAQFSHLQNTSNVAVYEHHRSLSEAGLTLTF